MLKTVLVIVVAAACAGATVGFVPAPSPADAASARVADGGNAHAVRVIALANPGAPHTPQARR
jgi:hypothetical protein